MAWCANASRVVAVAVTLSAAPAARAVDTLRMPTAAPPSGTGLAAGACIRLRDFGNHRIVDDKTLLIQVRSKATYRITMRNGCLRGAGIETPIVTDSEMASAMVCRPHQLDISIARDGSPAPCRVDSIVKLTPEELEAIPVRYRP